MILKRPFMVHDLECTVDGSDEPGGRSADTIEPQMYLLGCKHHARSVFHLFG